MNIPDIWTFKSDEIAQAFNEHVRSQLPWYDLATKMTAEIVRHYLPDRGLMYDVGASTGNIGRSVSDTLNARSASLIAIESSAEMAARYSAPGVVIAKDARDINPKRCDVIVCFLSLMFMPPADRPEWIAKWRSALLPGGAMIIFDKTPNAGGYLGTALSRLAWRLKVDEGKESPESVLLKELSLAGIQRPMDITELGSGAVEVFRFGDFAGWVIEANP